jgi:hypothetical protein
MSRVTCSVVDVVDFRPAVWLVFVIVIALIQLPGGRVYANSLGA